MPAAPALAWAACELSDQQLAALATPDAPQAVFGASLPPGQLREACRHFLAFYDAGARLLVGRTWNPAWWRILQAHGAVITAHESEKDLRYAAGPDAITAFVAKIRRYPTVEMSN